MTPGRTISLVFGLLFLGWGIWALQSGKVISTWGQMAHRPSLFYWVVTLSLLSIGLLNLVVAFRSR